MWRWYVLHPFDSHFDFFLFLSFLFVSFSIHSRILTFAHLVVLGGSIIACRSIERHIVALESDINIFKSLLLPMCEHNQEHTSQRGSVFAPPPGRWQSKILICCVRKFVIGFELAFYHFFLLDLKMLALANVILLSSSMFRVQNESPIHVLTADMFLTPSRTFQLSCYVVGLANLLAEAPSPPPICTRPFNKEFLDYVDIEAEEGEDSDEHGSPCCWLRFLYLRPPSHMYCFCFLFYKFICWISMWILQTSFNPLLMLDLCLISIL